MRPTMTRLLLAALGAAVLVTSAPGLAQAPSGLATLDNGQVRATFNGGRLTSLTDRTSGARIALTEDELALRIDGQPIDLSGTPAVSATSTTTSLTWRTATATVTATYELQPGWRFISRRLRVVPAASRPFRVNEVRTLSATLPSLPGSTLPLQDGKFGLVVRLADASPASSLILLHQNPYNDWSFGGASIAASYAPEMTWDPSNGPFESDRLLVGLVPRSGNLMPARSVPEWIHVADYDRWLRDQPSVDAAESDALVEMVRAFLLYRPERSIRVHVPWTENDYQIDVATPAGWAEYQRIITMASELGARHMIFAPSNSALSSLRENTDAWGWENLLFFGLGQKIRKGEWVPGRDAVPPALKTMIDFGAAKGVRFLAYAYPTLPFLQDPAWTRWTGGRMGGYRGVDTGERGFQDWWVNTLTAFTRATGGGGFSFDHWWIAYDEPTTTSKYAQWFGARRILEQLRTAVPDIVVDGRQQYMSFGPWTWLAGSYPHPTLTDEQPESFLAFPDLHTDRVSADRQRFAAWKYRVERFTPPEIMPGYITHQTERTDDKNVMRRDRFRPKDWDVLGWRYSLLSSIGTAPFNHTISMLPARDEEEYRAFSAADKTFFRHWLDWTDTNAALLKHLRPILGPPMIGRVDGTAAFDGRKGVIFLFNPNYRQLSGSFRLDASIGLTTPGRYLLRELYPEAGRLIGKPGAGVWSSGDAVVLPMRATEAMAVEVVPAPTTITTPLIFNVLGGAVRNGALDLTGAAGEPGTSRDVIALLADGKTLSATARFDGVRFGRGESIIPYDRSFAGGTATGAATIPSRVFAQLRARKAAWPVTYTADDLVAPWLGSDRLLLFIQIAEPDASMPVSLEIDGRDVPVTRAYNSIYGHAPQRTFLGFYADVSALTPDTPHRITVRTPRLQPGQFQGVFFENVEPEYVKR